MNRNITLLWIEAGKLLAQNPNASIICPVCERNSLNVKDSRSVENPAVIERELACPTCGSRNYLRLVRPVD
jgi:Zn finger protein HypA/HybF involved in hydrogenase expression